MQYEKIWGYLQNDFGTVFQKTGLNIPSLSELLRNIKMKVMNYADIMQILHFYKNSLYKNN